MYPQKSWFNCSNGRRQMQLASRSSTGRQFCPKLHAIPPRQQERLRPLGRAGKSRLGFKARAPLLQEIRGQPEPLPRQHSVPLNRWLPDSPRSPMAHTLSHCIRARWSGDGVRDQRHQRSLPKRFHDSTRYHQSRQQMLNIKSLPPTSSIASESPHSSQLTSHKSSDWSHDKTSLRDRNGERRTDVSNPS